MFEDILAQHGTKFLVAAISVIIGLGCLALVLWIVRNRPSSPFIRGGRNRQPRLAVLDAAAVDTRRRIVLVRRDDVEHLILIGGPTDVVIESRIAIAPAAAPAETDQAAAGTATAQAPVHLEPVSMAAAAATPKTAAAATPIAAVTAERAETARAPAQENVSAMSRVLYADDREAQPAMRGALPTAGQQQAATSQRPAMGTPLPQPVARPAATQPVAGNMPPATPAQQPVVHPQPQASQQAIRPSERSAADALDQARQRVLTTTPANAGTMSRSGTASLATPTRIAANPSQPAADNPELVSEFEKILEAEMSNPPVRTSGNPAVARSEPMVAQAIPGNTQKSREETEAEMARLLGEISANRKG